MASPKVGVNVPAATPRSPQVVSPSTSSISVKSKNTKKVLAGLVVGAAVITAIAVPLAARNAASNSSSTSNSKATNQQVVADVATVGCADGTREWFVSSGTFTDIAGCAGAWTNKGLVVEDEFPVPKGKSGLSECSAIGNSATTNAAGTGCNGADLCAVGWHICASQAEVATKSSGAGCDTSNQVSAGGVGFFATAQTGSGYTVCDAKQGSFNDIFGCGTDGSTNVDSTCAPLNRFTNDVCSGFNADANKYGWNCGSNGYHESNNITHGGTRGGVLCCKDEVIECTAEAEGWVVTGLNGYDVYVVKAAGYESDCTIVANGTSLSIAAAVDVPTEFLMNLYRNGGACSAQRPDESVYCPAYTGDNEYQDA